MGTPARPPLTPLEATHLLGRPCAACCKPLKPGDVTVLAHPIGFETDGSVFVREDLHRKILHYNCRRPSDPVIEDLPSPL